MSFQVIYETDNRGVVAWDTAFEPGMAEAIRPDGYSIATLEDVTMMDWLSANVAWPPYAQITETFAGFLLVDVWPTPDGAQPQPRGLMARFLSR